MPQILYLSACYTLSLHELHGLTSICFRTFSCCFFYPFTPLPLASSRCSFRESTEVNDSAHFLLLCLHDLRCKRSHAVLAANKTKVKTEAEETLLQPARLSQRRVSFLCSHLHLPFFRDESAPALRPQPLSPLSLILPALLPSLPSCFLRFSTFNTSLADGWNQAN